MKTSSRTKKPRSSPDQILEAAKQIAVILQTIHPKDRNRLQKVLAGLFDGSCNSEIDPWGVADVQDDDDEDEGEA